MPTYEFRCPLGHEFERFHKTMSTAPAELPCPECGALSARQLSGGAGLLFKGSGFYLTDYGKNAHRKAVPEKKTEGEKAEGEKAEGGKADGGKSESGKAEGGKAESVTAKREARGDGAKAESPEPKAQSPKPKSE